MTAFAGFLTAREAAKAMVPRGRGTMLFTGATASLRGGRGFSARFAGGKHAVRALAQSMARELGPQNIHVAHVVIDGAIDTEWIKTNFPERYNAGPDAVLNPDDIAERLLADPPAEAVGLDLRDGSQAVEGDVVREISSGVVVAAPTPAPTAVPIRAPGRGGRSACSAPRIAPEPAPMPPPVTARWPQVSPPQAVVPRRMAPRTRYFIT